MKGQILYIDDNELDLKVATMALAKLGYECIGFTEPKKGLEWVEKNVPHVVLLDIQIPGTTGYKLMPLIQQKLFNENVPIIIVSGRNQSQDVRLAVKAGAADYIIKPIDPLILQEKVERAHSSKVGDFAEIPVPAHLMPNVHFMNPVTVLAISEFGIRILSPQKLNPGDTVELGGLIPEMLGVTQVWVRAIHVESKSGGREFVTMFSFIGISERERQVVRRTCRQIWAQAKQEQI